MRTKIPDDDYFREENSQLKRELWALGKSPEGFDHLAPHELNARLKGAIRYAEREREASILGEEPPPTYEDPLSPDWIPDTDDMVHHASHHLLGDDYVLWPEDALDDLELERELHKLIDRLAERNICVGMTDILPERLLYRCLLEDLDEGIDTMGDMGIILDGCTGCCEECFQLPYCETGRDLAKEYDFAVPPPPMPPRQTGRGPGEKKPRPYWRHRRMDIDASQGSGELSGEDHTGWDDGVPF